MSFTKAGEALTPPRRWAATEFQEKQARLREEAEARNLRGYCACAQGIAREKVELEGQDWATSLQPDNGCFSCNGTGLFSNETVQERINLARSLSKTTGQSGMGLEIGVELVDGKFIFRKED